MALKPCGGTLAYEVVGGERVFREVRGGRCYRWRCEACGETGDGDGEARIHNALPCVVCAARPRVGMLFCAPCSRS